MAYTQSSEESSFCASSSKWQGYLHSWYDASGVVRHESLPCRKNKNKKTVVFTRCLLLAPFSPLNVVNALPTEEVGVVEHDAQPKEVPLVM